MGGFWGIFGQFWDPESPKNGQNASFGQKIGTFFDVKNGKSRKMTKKESKIRGFFGKKPILKKGENQKILPEQI